MRTAKERLDVVPEKNADGDQGSKMNSNVEHQALVSPAENTGYENQVSGTGNGQELRQSLYDSQYDQLGQTHGSDSFELVTIRASCPTHRKRAAPQSRHE